MNIKKIVALLITVLFLVLIFYKLDIHTLVQTFKDFDFHKVWLIIIFYALALYIRGFRWKPILMNSSKFTNLELAENFITGCFLNIFLPARGGDFYRAFKLGNDKQERKLRVFGSIILERTYDGICVFLILLFAVLLFCKQPWIIHITYCVGALFLGSMFAFYLIFRFNKVDAIANFFIKLCSHLPEKFSKPLIFIIEKVTHHINTFITGFESLTSLPNTTKAFVITCISWSFEILVVYLILNSFSLGLPPAASLFVISLISFSSMIPSSSVYLGPYQYAYILALGIFSIDKSTTLAVATIHQTLLMLIMGAMCLVYYVRDNFFVPAKKPLQ